MSDGPPAEFQGKFFLIATVSAQPGKGDDLQKLIAAVRGVAGSDREPGTLIYHTTRGSGDATDTFVLVEQYASKAAYEEHCQSEEVKTFAASDALKGVDIKWTQEFS